MPMTSLNSAQIESLRNILSQKYGKTLFIRQLCDLSALKSSDRPFIKGNDLHIPIQRNGSYLGTAVVPSAHDLAEAKQSDLSEMVKMVLEPSLYNWYLEQRENNIRELSKVDVELDNVRVLGDSLPDEDELSLEELNEKHSSSLVSHIVHFFGQNSTNIKKAALQLHELTGRWAFVPFESIKGQLHSSLDIARMGNMTIFIEEVANLNKSEIELITTYLEQDVHVDTPLIITASKESIGNLRNSEIDPNFVDELEISEFEMERAPLEHNRLKEVLELYFLRDEE